MEANDNHIARLEAEIQYLKGLLDKNGIPYDYEAFVEAARREEPVEIEFPVLTAEHAVQFYSYFRGRKDVYVKRGAKKGYYTQCNNFWIAGVCPKKNMEKVKCQDCPSIKNPLFYPLYSFIYKHPYKPCESDFAGLFASIPLSKS